MSGFWRSFDPGMSSGWVFMWVLALMAAFALAIALERLIYIYIKSNINAKRFMAQIRKYVEAKDYKHAIALCGSLRDKALPQAILCALVKASEMERPTSRGIQNAVDEGVLEIMPRLLGRSSYLAMLANVSTLTGLMGTIYGLILAFDSISNPGVDAAEKATLLANGIAVAMYTTLAGLAIAIPSVIVYTIIHNKTTRIVDEIDEHTVRLINLIAPEE